MGFELHRKGIHGSKLALTEIRISKVVVAFGDDICLELRKYGFCEVYLDKENNRVGFKPTKNVVTGFKTPKRKETNNLYISSKNLASMFPLGSYEAKRIDNMWVINVPEIATKK